MPEELGKFQGMCIEGSEGMAAPGLRGMRLSYQFRQECVMVFIDEASPVYVGDNENTAGGSANASTDLTIWNDLIGELNPPKWGVAIGNVAGASSGGRYNWIWPSDVAWPNFCSDNVGQSSNISRSTPVEQMRALYAKARAAGSAPLEEDPPMVTFLVDASGSMTTSTLQPGLNSFSSELTAAGIPNKVVTFGHERWLQILKNYVWGGRAV